MYNILTREMLEDWKELFTLTRFELVASIKYHKTTYKLMPTRTRETCEFYYSLFSAMPLDYLDPNASLAADWVHRDRLSSQGIMHFDSLNVRKESNTEK